MGYDIPGDRSNDWIGDVGCVSTTYDELTVAISVDGYNETLFYHGLVRVLNYNEIEAKWTPRR